MGKLKKYIYVCLTSSKSQKHFKSYFLHHNNKNLQLSSIFMKLLQMTHKIRIEFMF